MKVLLLLLKGFEVMEFSVFVDVIGWAREDEISDGGSKINVITCGLNKAVTSTFGVPVLVDTLLNDEINNVDQYDALAIPGGFEQYGFYSEGFNDNVLSIIREFNSKGKPIASVCVAALVLAESGILNGKKATTYHLGNSDRLNQLKKYKDIQVISNQSIVVDGNIITSCGPSSAPDVSFKLLELLTKNIDKVNKVKQLMGY